MDGILCPRCSGSGETTPWDAETSFACPRCGGIGLICARCNRSRTDCTCCDDDWDPGYEDDDLDWEQIPEWDDGED